MEKNGNGQWVFTDRTGERFVNNQGSWFTVIKYEGCHDITVKFDTGYITKAAIGKINSRRVKDYLFPSVVLPIAPNPATIIPLLIILHLIYYIFHNSNCFISIRIF